MKSWIKLQGAYYRIPNNGKAYLDWSYFCSVMPTEYITVRMYFVAKVCCHSKSPTWTKMKEPATTKTCKTKFPVIFIE